MSARLLVFGRSGQLAQTLAAAASPFEPVLAGRERLDLAAADPDIAGLIAAVRPARGDQRRRLHRRRRRGN